MCVSECHKECLRSAAYMMYVCVGMHVCLRVCVCI